MTATISLLARNPEHDYADAHPQQLHNDLIRLRSALDYLDLILPRLQALEANADTTAAQTALESIANAIVDEHKPALSIEIEAIRAVLGQREAAAELRHEQAELAEVRK